MDGYNERLFSGGVRAWFHLARFRWVADKVSQIDLFPLRVVELGCFDGRLVSVLSPQKYVGFDADWEGGLSSAQNTYAQREGIAFVKCQTPNDLRVPFMNPNLFVSLETLEHILPGELEEYLRRLSELKCDYGLVTVPNEKGIVFLFKYLAKLAFSWGGESYRLAEVIAATVGLMKYVQRKEHKGFDYEELEKLLARYWRIERVEGVHCSWFPNFLNFQIGFVLRNKL